MDHQTRRVAWTSAVIHGLVHACVLLLPAILGDVQRSLGVSLLALLGAFNTMCLVFGLAAIPAGYFADRVGSRAMLILASLGCAVSCLIVVVATNFSVFWLGLVGLGLSAGLYHPSGLSLLSRGVASGERGRAIGIHGVGGNFGEVIAPSLAASCAMWFGWRWGFGVMAAAALVGAALATSLPDRQLGSENAGAPRPLVPALRSMWRSRPLRFLLLGGIAGGFVYRGVLTFLPMHLGRSVADPRLGAYLTSAVLVAGMIAQRVGGELADRMSRERLLLIEVGLFTPVLLCLGLVSGPGLVVLALAFGFLWYLAQPLGSTLAAAYAESTDHGLLYGIQFAVSFGLGSFATTAGGLLVERGGTSLAFLGFGAAGLLQLGAAVGLVRAVRRTPVPTGSGTVSAVPDTALSV